ncbi:MAG: proton-conducting transporter membrane subunit [Rickettsiaceae bacterium]|nr:proton-conducting transporter membrane subunit [Rickettsiaceae bacterium]
MIIAKHIIDQSPAIFILTPIIFAIIILLVQKNDVGRVIFTATNFILLSLVYGVFISRSNYAKYYVFGGWTRKAGIEFKQDFTTGLLLFLMYLVVFLFSIFSHNQLKKEFNACLSPKVSFIPYALFLIIEAAYAGMILTNDIFNLYVFMELCALATYPIYAISREKRAYISAFNYLIICSIASTLILISIGFILSNFGSLNLEIIKEKFTANASAFKPVIILFIIGCMIKLGIFPFHTWKINAYHNSSILVAGFLLPISTLCIASIAYKFKFLIHAISAPITLISFGAISILLTALASLHEKNYVKIIIYSSISSAGFYMLALNVSQHTSNELFAQLAITDTLIKLGLLFIPISLSESNLYLNDIRFFFGAKRLLLEKLSFLAIIFIMWSAASFPPSVLFFFKISILREVFMLSYIWALILLVSFTTWCIVYIRLFNSLLSPSNLNRSYSTSRLGQCAAVTLSLLIGALNIYHHLFAYVGWFLFKDGV